MAVGVIRRHVVLRRVLPLAQQGLSVHHLGGGAFVEFLELRPQLVEELAEFRRHVVLARATTILFVGLQGVVEEVPHQLLRVGGGILGAGTVLGRVFVGALIGAVAGQAESLHPVFATRVHGRQGRLPEVVGVEGIAVVLPKVHAVPGVGDGVVLHPVRARAIDVVLGGERPALRLTGYLACVLAPLRPVAGLTLDVVQEGQMQLAEIGGLSGPVVHLHIDVRMDVGVPRGRVAVVPDALQVARQVDTAAAGNHQVAAIVEVELFEQ